MKIQSIVSFVCQKELHKCFIIASMVLLQINEPLRHHVSISLCTDPSGKLPALELHVISVRCSSVCDYGWLEPQPGGHGAHFPPLATEQHLCSSLLTACLLQAGLACPPTPRSSTRVALTLLPLHSISYS